MKIRRILALLFAWVMLFNVDTVLAEEETAAEIIENERDDFWDVFPMLVRKNINEDSTVDVEMVYAFIIADGSEIDVSVTDEESGELIGEYSLTSGNDTINLKGMEKGKVFKVKLEETMNGEHREFVGSVNTKYTEKDKPEKNETEPVKKEDKSNKEERDADWAENIADLVSEDSRLEITVESKKYNLSEEYTFNKSDLEEQREVIKRFLTALVEQAGSEPYDEDRKYRKDSYEYAFWCYLHAGEGGRVRTDIIIWDDFMNINGKHYQIENAAEILDDVMNVWTDEFEVLDQEDNGGVARKEQSYSGKLDFKNSRFIGEGKGLDTPFKYREKIEFDIELDESFEDTFLEEYADIGESVHCTIQNLWAGQMNFILTIEGSKGSDRFWEVISSGQLGGGFSGGYTGRILRFDKDYKIVDNVFMYIPNETDRPHEEIQIQGSLKNKQVSGVTLKCVPNTSKYKINPSNAAEGYNIDYEYYGTEEELKDGRNIYTLFGIEAKEIEIQKMLADTKDLQPQDPKRYVSELRMEEDGEKLDYYIGFIAQMDADLGFSKKNAPSWYEKLGDDVKVTLVGFTQTVNGKDKHNWSMLRFSGSKGTKWFNLGVGEASDALVKGEYDTDEKLYVYMEFNELISFDGDKIVRNTVEFDTAEATVNFKNDGSLELESIVIGADSHEVTVSAKDIKYIGGGKVEYEKLW